MLLEATDETGIDDLVGALQAFVLRRATKAPERDGYADEESVTLFGGPRFIRGLRDEGRSIVSERSSVVSDLLESTSLHSKLS